MRTYEDYSHLTLASPNINDWVLGSVLEQRARRSPNKEFLQWKTLPPVTFSEANGIVNRLAHGMSARGLGKGDNCAIMLPNCLEYIYTWFALSKLGAVEVPVNNSYKGYFLAHVLNTTRATTAIIHKEYLDSFLNCASEAPCLRVLYVLGLDKTFADQRKQDGVQIRRYEELVTDDDSNPDVQVNYFDPGAILFTSGTTGPSKGVMMPHAQLYFYAEQLKNLVQLTEDDVYMTANPFFHVNAQTMTIYPSLIAGCKACFYEKFSASNWTARLRESRATVTNLLGAMMELIWQQPETAADAKHELRAVFAAPTPYAIKGGFMKRFAIDYITEVYGQTEVSLPIMTPYGEERPPGAVGMLVSEWFDAKLVDPNTDEEVPDGEMGELVIRHRCPWTITQGYYGMPEETAKAFRNLWFHTGDGLKRDQDGWYYLIDRIKDALRRKGENISSYEVEKIISAHPAVGQCAVIGLPAAAGYEDEIKACIVANGSQEITPQLIIEWCERNLPSFMVPRYIEFMENLPKTPNEKVKKKVLRESGLNEFTWDRVKADVKLRSEV